MPAFSIKASRCPYLAGADWMALVNATSSVLCREHQRMARKRRRRPDTGMSHWTICRVSGCASARAFSSTERVREMATTVALNDFSRIEVAARPIPLCSQIK